MRKKRFTKAKTTADNLERRFDEGKSVLDYFDAEKGMAVRRITLDMPEWALRDLDGEAARRGIARQALIKNWLIDRLDSLKERKSA